MHRFVAPLLAILLFAGSVRAAPADVSTGIERVALDLIRGAIEASGTSDPIDLTLEQQAVVRAVSAVVEQVGRGRPTRRRAERLHRILHRDLLREYREEADSLVGLVRDGRYNCVSATLVYGLAARELGYEARILEQPGHLRLRLLAGDRSVDLETTLAGVAPGAEAAGPAKEAPLEAAIGWIWLNRAWRAIEAGDPLGASSYVLEARRHLPDLDERSEVARVVLTRSFSESYEHGDFESAYVAAAAANVVHPGETTARDRLLAAALKRIEDACDGGRPEAAWDVLRDVARRIDRERDVERLERRAFPLVAASAVRVGAWELAGRAANAYTEVELDPRESGRLRAWVEERGLEAGAAQSSVR